MSERAAVGYREFLRQNWVSAAAWRTRGVSTATLGVLGLATIVLSSCRTGEVSIPGGNGSGTGASVGAAGSSGGGVGGTAGIDGTGGLPLPTDGGDPGDDGQAGGHAGRGMTGGVSGAGGNLGSGPGAAGRAGGDATGGTATGGGTGASTSGAAGAAGQAGARPPSGGATGTAPGGQAGTAASTGGAPGSATGGRGTPPPGTGGADSQNTTGGPGAPPSSGGGANSQAGTGGMPAGSGGAAPEGGAGGQPPPAGTGAATGATGESGVPPLGTGGSAGSPLAAVTSEDAAGTAITVRLGGSLTDSADDFNAPLGTNGRGCATCHAAAQSMSLTPAGAQARFDATDGTDPLFRPVDGAVSPLADVSTADARRTAYALLLSKGLIRVGLPMPANGDFDLVAVSDPYGYASAAELSLFRRPLPAANLPFLSTVMWDGREGLVTPDDPANALLRALASQAGDAVLGHSQAASPLEAARIAGIVEFEMSIFSAQGTNLTAGPLNGASGLGGPLALTQQTFYPGINDANGADPANPFSPSVFTMYLPWQATEPQGSDADARRQIALGEQLFNTRSFSVTGVAGLTTADQPTVTVTCSTCHDAPGAGSNSSGRFFDLGLASASRAGSELPVYTLQERSTGKQVQVSDPGRALITGAFKDVAMFKVPTLRGLAARAPYFHNGGASTLSGVVGFYNGRFGIGLSSDEKAALAAFLSSL